MALSPVAGGLSAPTSSVFYAQYQSGLNVVGNNHIAYCFSEVPGFSKIGKYTGNGSTTGPFVYCGFKPKFVMIKQSTGAAAHWYIIDSSRDIANAAKHQLQPNLANAESVGVDILDFLANGFMIKTSSAGSFNGYGDSYIFMAFAENPFGGSNVAPATAR